MESRRPPDGCVWVEWVRDALDVILENGRTVRVRPGDQLLIREQGDGPVAVFVHRPVTRH